MSASLAAEYLGDEAPQKKNGHDPKFNIVAATDPATLAMLRSRDAAIKDRRLRGQHAKFVIASIDRCSQKAFYGEHGRGVCVTADSVMAAIVGVSRRTVIAYRSHAATADYLWFSKETRPDKWPITKYHLTCLHAAPKQRTEWTDQGASYAAGGVGRGGPNPEKAQIGREKIYAALKKKREQKLLALQGGVAVVPPTPLPPPVIPPVTPPVCSSPRLKLPEKSVLQAISHRARNYFLPTGEAGFSCQEKRASPDKRSGLLPSREAGFSGGEKPVAPVKRSGLHRTGEANCEHKETQLRAESLSLERGKPPAPEKSFLEAIKERFPDLAPWLETFNGAFRSKVEKSRERIAVQFRAAAPNQKPLLKRKMAALDELLDGPSAPPAEKPAKVAASAATLPPKEEWAKGVKALREAIQ